jgi:GNAT superfamily N-acetyltransferase
VPGVTVRPTRASDLPALGDVWRAAAHPGRVDPPPPGVLSLYYQHQLATGESWVAEDADGLAGYAASFTRSGVTFLSDLFVVPARQSRGIGAALLHHALARVGGTRCTMSSLDPRALALYTRAGLRPRWPHMLLAASPPDFAALPGAAVDVTVASAGDPAFVEWDARLSGLSRPEDHAFWRAVGAVPLWFAHVGDRVGCGYVWHRADANPDAPEVRVGPLGAVSPEHAVGCVGAALRWAASSAASADPRAAPREWTYRVAVSAAHAALAPLLEAEFRVSGLEIFCCSRDDLFFDPRAYLALAGPEGTSLL